jgi:hypothetical protein
MVDVNIAGPKHSGDAAPSVIRDEMDATRHMADGKYYTSKSKFRGATRDAGCVEVGNETSTLMKPRAPITLDRQKRREDIRRALRGY